jgi:CheY-like chemotaxis protein
MKRVLDVGQCAADHGSICRLVQGHFDARVEGADDLEAVLAKLRAQQFDLVLVNRLLDLDSSEGLEIIRQIKADPALAHTPVMLVTNFEEYQQRAIAAGAEPGFGKAQIHDPQVVERLRNVLG